MTKLKKWIASATLACLWACGSPEQSTIDQFFRAARTNDPTTLASMSAVGPPVEVESWKVVEVSSRSTEPFALPELLDRFEAATKERDAAVEAGQKYASDQPDVLERIIPKLREGSDYKFRGKMGEIQEEWLRLVEERREKEGTFQELKRAVRSETGLATKSVMRQVNVENLDGDVAVTEMLLRLKPRDGDELPYRVVLRKYKLSEPESDRIEPARWVILDIEGTTPEARAAASAPAKASEPSSESADATEPSKVADNQGAAESKQPARNEPTYRPRELRGLARVQILTPETKVEGDEVITTIRVRNVSKDWITRFMVTEHWYDEQGNAVRSGSRTHQKQFMPGEVIEMELRTRKNPKFYQNQFEFSHANGDVKAFPVGSFPKDT